MRCGAVGRGAVRCSSALTVPHPQDIRLLNAGKAPQKAAEIDRDLDKADAMIRVLFNDVQTLKDGRHPQGEQMYRRVYRLHERLVAIRTEYNLRLKSGAPVAAQAPAALGQRPRQELDDATLRYLQDLLAWVEENQRRLGAAEWGVDLPTVESHLGSHRGLHQSIEEFRAKIERARADEVSRQPAADAASRPHPSAPRRWRPRPDLPFGVLLSPGGAGCPRGGCQRGCHPVLTARSPVGAALAGPPQRLPGVPGQAGPAVRQAAGEAPGWGPGRPEEAQGVGGRGEDVWDMEKWGGGWTGDVGRKMLRGGGRRRRVGGGVQAHPIPAPPPQNSSKSRLRHLESLHAFVSAATKELMWLNEKEEEEVNFDWSDRNPNMTAKKENYSVRSAGAAALCRPPPAVPVPRCPRLRTRLSSGVPSLPRPCAWPPHGPSPSGDRFVHGASCSQGQGGLSGAFSPISSHLISPHVLCCAACSRPAL